MPTDATRTGSREATPEQRADLVQTLKRRHVGLGARVTVEDLAAQTGIPGRTIRAIVSEADGVEFCVGGGDEGLYLAESFEEAEGMTGRLFSQAMRMRERAQRRLEYARKNLPRRQGQLI